MPVECSCTIEEQNHISVSPKTAAKPTGRSLDHVCAEQVNPGGETPLFVEIGGASGTDSFTMWIISYQEPQKYFPGVSKPMELMESWQRQLDEQGPGVHNVTFAVDDFDRVTTALRQRGAQTLFGMEDVDLRPAGLEYDGELPVHIIDARAQSGLRFELLSTKAGWIPGEAP